MYELFSGQKINAQKSSITFSLKTSSETKDIEKSILGIEKEGGVVKYLGFLEHFGRRKKDLFKHIVDHIKQRAGSWATKKLIQAGILIMIKSVLSSIPTHMISCFQIPKSLYKRIQLAFTRFWWDESSEKRKMCWVAWKKLTKLKKLGGLGFREVETFNESLLGKLAWRLLMNLNSFFARILLGKYAKYQSPLDVLVSPSAWHGWRSILVGRDLLLQNLGWTIGDGKSVKIWDDCWLSLTQAVRPYAPPHRTHRKLDGLLTDFQPHLRLG